MSQKSKFSFLRSPNFNLNIAMFSYSTSMVIPQMVSSWYFTTKVGILPLIPFQLFITCLITTPIMFMELAFGQYSNKAAVKVWNFCPIFKGIGIGSHLVFIIHQIYYTVQCSCLMAFTVLTLTNYPQWKSCNNTWNTINCFTLRNNFTKHVECNGKHSIKECDKMIWQSSIEQFYLRRLWNSEGPHSYVKAPQGELLLCSFITATIVFLATFRGTKSAKNVLLVLVVLPTVQLIILLFQPLTNATVSVTLTGLFREANFSKFSDLNIWIESVCLLVFSSGVGLGVYTTLGARQSFRSSLHFKALGMNLLNVFFVVIYSITIHNFVISLCTQNKIRKEECLVFEQELRAPISVFFLDYGSKFWMMMWLSHCYMLGLRRQIVMMSISLDVMYNSFPSARNHQSYYVFAFCFLIFFMAIFLSTSAGYWVIKALDEAIKNLILLLLNSCTLFAVVFIYGIRTFKDDINFMLGIKPSVVWQLTYIFNTFLFSSILIYNLYRFLTKKTTIPWIYITQNFFFWSLAIFVVLFGVIHIVTSIFAGKLKIMGASPEWGPRYQGLVKSRDMFKAYNLAKEYLYRQERFRRELGRNT